MKVINFNGVWEKYRIKFIKQKDVCWEEVWALEDVNFKVEEGNIIGIIGKNGAGKTTLLKLIAGMLIPDKGEVDIKGKVAALMELGAGFNLEFTGIENINLNAAIYGLSEADLQQRMGDIIKFAGLGEFINAPIKYYSQGMYMRLAFALAIFVEPDILLIDDVLAVGDAEAQEKCIKKIFELKQMGKTIILVSHDMGMVSKLCDRLILLEKGRIVQEDSTVKVIPYYLETIGDKKGIAVLEKEGLRVVFNNGKVILDYNGFSLTNTMGGYVSFFVPSLNSWSSSFNLSWQVKSFGTDKIVAEGKSYEGSLSQIWTLQLENGCLQWQVEVKGEDIKQSHIDLFFMSQYKSWQILDKASDFPPFTSKSNWQNLGLNSCFGATMLGLSGAWQCQDCPGLILEQKTKDSLFKLFNAGYDQEARVIQWDLDLKAKNSVSIKIFPNEREFTGYIRETKQKFLLKQQEEQEQYRLKQQEEQEQYRLNQQKEQESFVSSRTITCGDLRLFVDEESMALRIFFKDKEVTHACGLHYSFNNSKESFNLFNAQWKTENISGKRLILTLTYPQVSVAQIWDIQCIDENTLRIKLEIESNGQVSFTDEGMKLELKDCYQRWMTPEEKGDLLASRYINNVAPIPLKDNRIPGVILISRNIQHSPHLLLQCTLSSENIFFNIYKRKEKDSECIGIYAGAITPRKRQTVFLGKYTYFEGEIVFGKAAKIEKFARKLSAVELSNNYLKFAFNQGKGSIFLNKGEEELTSGLGVYTSVRSLGIWYDSYQAVWEVKRKENNKLILEGFWPHIALSQIWQIKMVGKNLIFWQVDMEVYEQLDLEMCQANIMLCPQYKNWAASKSGRGNFSDEYTERYDILPFRFWYGQAKEIVAKAEILPGVCFQNDMENEELRAIIENTDDLYQARLLQYQKANVYKMLPGKYPYFKGVIKVES